MKNHSVILSEFNLSFFFYLSKVFEIKLFEASIYCKNPNWSSEMTPTFMQCSYIYSSNLLKTHVNCFG